jgi:hypothetical protein
VCVWYAVLCMDRCLATTNSIFSLVDTWAHRQRGGLIDGTADGTALLLRKMMVGPALEAMRRQIMEVTLARVQEDNEDTTEPYRRTARAVCDLLDSDATKLVRLELVAGLLTKEKTLSLSSRASSLITPFDV